MEATCTEKYSSAQKSQKLCELDTLEIRKFSSHEESFNIGAFSQVGIPTVRSNRRLESVTSVQGKWA